jgi:predicted DNA-binding transcriptional regulator AlpA
LSHALKRASKKKNVNAAVQYFKFQASESLNSGGKLLGLTPQHIYKMAKAGLIPCFHVKDAVRFRPAELAEWIKQEIE